MPRDRGTIQAPAVSLLQTSMLLTPRRYTGVGGSVLCPERGNVQQVSCSLVGEPGPADQPPAAAPAGDPYACADPDEGGDADPDPCQPPAEAGRRQGDRQVAEDGGGGGPGGHETQAARPE